MSRCIPQTSEEFVVLNCDKKNASNLVNYISRELFTLPCGCQSL
jgi:hypothetical protein